MIEEVDEDGSGTIEFDEFLFMMNRHVEEKGPQPQEAEPEVEAAPSDEQVCSMACCMGSCANGMLHGELRGNGVGTVWQWHGKHLLLSQGIVRKVVLSDAARWGPSAALSEEHSWGE